MGMSVPESRQGARPKPTADAAQGDSEIGAQVRPVSNEDYTELPAPAQVSQGSSTGKPPVKSALKQSNNGAAASAANAAPTAKASNPHGSLLDG